MIGNARLGLYIVEMSDRNDGSFSTNDVRGVSTDKALIPTRANMDEVQIDDYKIVRPSWFTYNSARMADTASIALNRSSESVLVSKVYPVFATDIKKLMPGYLALFFDRNIFAQYCAFIAFGSARPIFDINDLKQFSIPVPSVEVQQKVVDIYEGVRSLYKSVSGSIEGLQKLSELVIERIISDPNVKHDKLGNYIEEVDVRNRDGAVKKAMGISVNKIFIDTKSESEDAWKQKVISPGQFAFVEVTSRNGEKISLALKRNFAGIMSATYICFETLSGLNSEFLYQYLSRPDFDRYARFHSWGSARETFTWGDMCNVLVPVPSNEQQDAIANIYSAIEQRKELAARLKKLMTEICPVLIKGVIDEKI